MSTARALAATALLSSIVAGCSGSGDRSMGSATASAATTRGTSEKALCPKAQALRERLAAIDVKPTRVSTRAHLPMSGDGSPPPEQFAVLEYIDKPTLNGEPVRSATDLSSRIEERHMRALLLAIDAQAKVRPVLSLVEGAASDTTLYVVASPKDAKREPLPSSFAKDGEISDPSQRARLFGEAIKNAVGSCKAASTVFQRLGAESGGASAKAEMVVKELPTAVDACDCAVDDDFVGMMAYLLGGDPPVVAKKLVLSREGSAKKIQLADLDGQKLYDSLPADGAPVVFVP